MSKPCEHCLIEIHRDEYGFVERYSGDTPHSDMSIREHRKGDKKWSSGDDRYKETFFTLYYETEPCTGGEVRIHYCPWCGRRLDGDT